MRQIPDGESRRDFIKQTALTTAALAALPASWLSASDRPAPAKAKAPWYQRTLRWGQTNIREIDPTRYDIAWWREHWKRTHTQGVIVNAGGIVAYYPSRTLLHRPALPGPPAPDEFPGVSCSPFPHGSSPVACMNGSPAGSDEAYNPFA